MSRNVLGGGGGGDDDSFYSVHSFIIHDTLLFSTSQTFGNMIGNDIAIRFSLLFLTINVGCIQKWYSFNVATKFIFICMCVCVIIIKLF